MAAKMALNLSRILQAQERFRLPHPLSKFATNSKINDGPCAAAVLKYVQDLASTEPESGQHGAAEWFLFKSERAFFFACSEAGIDAEKLRCHLKQWQQLGPEEMDRLLQQWTRDVSSAIQPSGRAVPACAGASK